MMVNEGNSVDDLFREHTPTPDHLLQQWTDLLRNAPEPPEGIAAHILYDFCARAKLRQQQSQHTLDWLADAINKMLRHQYARDAREAFSLPPRRQGKPTTAAEVQVAIDTACYVHLAIQRGYSEPEAIRWAASIFEVDEKTIRRRCERAAGWPDAMNPDTDWKAYFERLGKRLPEARPGRT
jgi:hypothetical protein